MGTGCKGNRGNPDGKQNSEAWDRRCHRLTHVGEEGEVKVFPELFSGAAAPVLKHMQIGLALELGGKVGHRDLLQISPASLPCPVNLTKAPGTGLLLRAKKDAAAVRHWSTADMGPDPCFSSHEGLELGQVTV